MLYFQASCSTKILSIQGVFCGVNASSFCRCTVRVPFCSRYPWIADFRSAETPRRDRRSPRSRGANRFHKGNRATYYHQYGNSQWICAERRSDWDISRRKSASIGHTLARSNRQYCDSRRGCCLHSGRRFQRRKESNIKKSEVQETTTYLA